MPSPALQTFYMTFGALCCVNFSILGLAFEDVFDKNFMALLPVRESQLRLLFKATQGSRPLQRTDSKHPTTEVTIHEKRGALEHCGRHRVFQR